MNKAFTLIELLVVIAIIGVLSSIVLLSLQGAKDQAELAEAQSFARQVRASLGLSLVGEWRFDDGAGMEAKDGSGYDNHGDLAGDPQWVTGIFSQALDFDGTGDYVEIANSSDFNSQDSTWCLWFKTNGNFGYGGSTYSSTLIGRHDSAGSLNGVHMIISETGSITWQSKSHINNRPFNMSYSGGYTDGKWHYVCGIAASPDATAVLYIDGVQRGIENSVTISWNFNNQAVMIGDSIDSWWGQFSGEIDEVRIYNQALSLAEIQQLYAQGAANHGIVLK